MASIRGIVERITYRNEETCYTVARLRRDGTRVTDNLTTVVGIFPFITPGETLKLEGEWVSHPEYGLQFKVSRAETVVPATINGIEKYLGSGLIKGIGPVTARRLVKHFGLETLDVIENRPDRLTEVDGIGPKKAEVIRRGFAEQREIQNVMVFLGEYGVSPTYAVKIFKRYGNDAIAVVRQNPYRLADEIFGIGFKTADKIASKLGIEPSSLSRVAAGVRYFLNQRAEDGHVFYPVEGLASEAAKMLDVPEARVDEALEGLEREGVIIREGTRIYLAAFYHCERGVAERLGRLARIAPRPLRVDLDRELLELGSKTGVALAPDQRRAVETALRAGVVVLTGGPGTGKTTTVRSIIRIFEAHGLKVLLAAPTGRAAKRLSEATGREAKTLHRLLEVGFCATGIEFARNEANPLDADAVIVDEVSMVDIVLMYDLLKAIRPGTRLILVGDADQLPSVGPGNVLRDIIESGAVSVVRLQEIFRQARNSMIIVNAHRINRGEFPLLNRRTAGKGAGSRDAGSKDLGSKDAGSKSASSGDAGIACGSIASSIAGGRIAGGIADGDTGGRPVPGDFFFIDEEDPEKVAGTVVELVARRIPGYLRCHPIDDIQVITPMRRTVTGVDNLNIALREALNPPAPGKVEIRHGMSVLRQGDKVMQIRNNYNKMVFNGDIGRIEHIDEEDRVIVVSYPDSDGTRSGASGTRRVEYEQHELDELVLAYAMSVHKSQGGEYPVVVMPVTTQHYMMLQRNLLYTGITRAKRLVVLVGTKKAIAIAVKNTKTDSRYTALAEGLRAMCQRSLSMELP
ncbi:MAG TPA: AAA family ATPase [Firmicutes bacterium]|nr:AAA family ATPase [Bacillota bacterium]